MTDPNAPPADLIVASVVHDDAVFERHLAPCLREAGVASIVVRGDADSCLAQLYNEVLDTTSQRFVAFSHPDVVFSPDLLQHRSESAVVGGVGVVERRAHLWSLSRSKHYVWAGEIDANTQVDCFDSCFLVADKELGLRFDAERFDGLHLCVADYCYQARSIGKTCLVPAARRFEHHSSTVKSQGYCWGDYEEYRRRLEQKWAAQFRVVTT